MRDVAVGDDLTEVPVLRVDHVVGGLALVRELTGAAGVCADQRSGSLRRGRMGEMTMTSQIRALATALPEVAEKQHHLFKVPVWQVRGRTFLGMGRDETTAVFCIAEESANVAATADPEHAAAVRRRDARRSFLGLEVQLAGVAFERIESLVREAWLAQAPRMLVRDYLGQT